MNVSAAAVAVEVSGVVRLLRLADERDTLRALYRELDCRCVDVVRLPDGLDMWVDDESLLMSDPQVNRPATAVAWQRLGGIPSQPFFGAVLFATSNDEGDTIDLPGAAVSALLRDLAKVGADVSAAVTDAQVWA